jgi:hypothetical protein
MGPPDLLPIRTKVFCGFLSPLVFRVTMVFNENISVTETVTLTNVLYVPHRSAAVYYLETEPVCEA